MRCKKGDMAIVIRASADSAIPRDSIVRCIQFYSGMAQIEGRDKFEHVSVWLVEYRGQEQEGGYSFNVRDEDLRPIRDNDGEDETLQWAPVPVKEIA